MLKDQLLKLATEENNPCLTLSLNTHRTHPENTQDSIVLKNLCMEAEARLTQEFGKRAIAPLLEKLSLLSSEINKDYNLNSLHIFLSNDTKEIIKSLWPVSTNKISISSRFDIRDLILASNRSESYFILLLSQSGVHLYDALDDAILSEIRNEDFPFSENKYYVTYGDKRSDSKLLDDMVRVFLNQVDKAMVRVYLETKLQTVVICTEDNFSRLMQVADQPAIYFGYVPVNYNAVTQPELAKQAWVMVQEKQSQRRADAIRELKEAIGKGNVLTDLQEIYNAALDGRGDLLISNPDFTQAVRFTGTTTFERIDDASDEGSTDDIVSTIAWEVMSKNGRVIFSDQESFKELAPIALKVRY